MVQKAPGKHYREGISMIELIAMFPDDGAAYKWLEAQIWPNGPRCPKCGAANIAHPTAHKDMTHRCRECKTDFNLKTGTLMKASKISYQNWAIAIYLFSTNLKGVSSMKLHRDLKITQKSAWHMAHRIRDTFKKEGQSFSFAGPVEADETFLGGKDKNRHAKKKKGRDSESKTPVAGIKDRGDQRRYRQGGKERKQGERSTVREGQHRAGSQGLHGRRLDLCGNTKPYEREALPRAVRHWRGAHQRDRVLLVPVKTWLLRHSPPLFREACESLHQRVRGADTTCGSTTPFTR